jgi:hypothetical protein
VLGLAVKAGTLIRWSGSIVALEKVLRMAAVQVLAEVSQAG